MISDISNNLCHYSAGFTLDTYTYTTQRMKRAADTVGNVIGQASKKAKTGRSGQGILVHSCLCCCVPSDIY